MRAAGFTGECFDLNLDLYEKIAHKLGVKDWFFADYLFDNEQSFERFHSQFLAPVICDWIQLIKAKSPRWVGLSVISFRCQNITTKICQQIREQLPEVKVAVGGGGVLGEARRFGQIEKKNWVAELYEQGLIDAYVRGDGELSLLELLRGQTQSPGINGREPKEIPNLSTGPFPDYSDYKVQRYLEITAENQQWTHRWELSSSKAVGVV